jgi:hypothetical protein
MSKRFNITADHGYGTVYLCFGGGAFTWWTVHRSMASQLRKEDAERLQKKHGGTIIPLGG